MKTIRIAAMALLVCAVSQVQAQYALQTGKMQFNGGIGINQSIWGFPVYVGLDYGYEKNISFGGELSVRSFFNSTSYSSIIGLTANANYHFVELLGIQDIYDVYAGVDLGFYSGLNSINVGVHIGGRYYLKKNTAINLELGGGLAFTAGKVGLSILLND
jgi:hypothetical protein